MSHIQVSVYFTYLSLYAPPHFIYLWKLEKRSFYWPKAITSNLLFCSSFQL